jgi:hypothetical protein
VHIGEVVSINGSNMVMENGTVSFVDLREKNHKSLDFSCGGLSTLCWRFSSIEYRVVQENCHTWHIYYTNVHKDTMSEWI